MSEERNITPPVSLQGLENEPVCEYEREAGAEDKNSSFDQKRQELSFKEDVTLHLVKKVFLITSTGITTVVLLVFLWHLLAPPNARWLSESEVYKIKDIAITIVVGLLMSYGTSLLFKKKAGK